MKMAINPVAQTDAAKAAAQTAAVNTNQTPPAAKEPAPAKPQPAVTDTVQISTSAKAVMQEVQETAAQTAQEANGGDRQAQRLLAKEAAARAAELGNNKPSPFRIK
jgi:hypothetical protein